MGIAYRVLLIVLAVLSLAVFLNAIFTSGEVRLSGILISVVAVVVGIICVVMSFKMYVFWIVKAGTIVTVAGVLTSAIPTGGSFDKGKAIGGGVVAFVAATISAVVMLIY